MAGTPTILVAVEDFATAGIVAVEAARVIQDEAVETVVLLHVLDPHTVVAALFSLSGAYGPVGESTSEGQTVLAMAESVLRGELNARNLPIPTLVREIVDGAGEKVGAIIARVAAERGAGIVVLGARRPHALGRLTHPDVRAHLGDNPPYRVHVVALQEAPPHG